MESKIIDIHTHIFNLKYIPVAGVIHQFPNKIAVIPYFIADGIARIVLSFTNEDTIPSHKKFMDYSEEQILEEIATKVPRDVFNDEVVNQAIKDLVGDEIIQLNEHDRMFLENKSDSTIREILEQVDRSEINTLTKATLSKILKLALRKFFHKYVEKPVQALKWVYFQTWTESEIINTLYSTYGNVNHFVHHDMDMDSWYRGEPTFKYEKQIKRISYLVKNSKGKLKAFVAFDPKRENCMQIVEDALELGYSGVKFYPPSGYYPIGNPDPSLDENNKKLFAMCCNPLKPVPLFAHCNREGMMAGDGFGKYSHPRHWSDVLNYKDVSDNKVFSKLTLCLGHAGGEGWVLESDTKFKESLAGQVYDLCMEFDNVYCEFGYLDEILGENENNIRIFKNRLKKLFRETPKFIDKIMYGSDYHMLYREVGHEAYLHRFQNDIFSDAELAPHKDKFFYQNAERYLGINQTIPSVMVETPEALKLQ